MHGPICADAGGQQRQHLKFADLLRELSQHVVCPTQSLILLQDYVPLSAELCWVWLTHLCAKQSSPDWQFMELLCGACSSWKQAPYAKP